MGACACSPLAAGADAESAERGGCQAPRATARHKAAPPRAPGANGRARYNEEDFMDGDLVDEDMH